MQADNKIMGMIDTMSVAELKTQLLEYMMNDASLKPRLVSIEIRLNKASGTKSRYDVLLVNEQGDEIPVKFHDRYSRLIYIYTLLHPHGYHRRTPAANNYRALCQLYNLLYYKDSDALLRTITGSGYDHFFSHYVTQSRKAIRQASPLADEFVIDHPQSHNGKTLIPFANQGGTVIIDASLQ